MTVDLRLGDCLIEMPKLETASIDAVICDPPYGTTACRWDTVIPFEPMWAELKRIAKPKAAIVLFGSQPFISALVMSNPKMFRYEWVWRKTRAANFMNVKNKPLCVTESVCVFSDGTTANHSPHRMNYYPQGVTRSGQMYKRPNPNSSQHHYMRPSHKAYTGEGYAMQGTGYPKNILEFKSEINHTDHPTQKPVALMEYLIRTYTNEGDTVLDFTCGSGTTLVACVNTNRNGIGIEKEPQYFAIAERRISEAQAQLALPVFTTA